MTVQIPEHLSHSQASTLSKCAGQWYLERGLKLPGRPGWAQIAGSAIHSASEEWDLNLIKTGHASEDPDYLRDLFEAAFENEITKTLQFSEYPQEEWRASGRASKAWPNKEDETFWRTNGWEHVRSWAAWRINNPWEIAQLPAGDGTLVWGIEVEFLTHTPDGIPVRGFVDRVLAQGNDLMVLDLKSGTYTPDSSAQLGTYAYGLDHEYGVRPKWGCYWMSRTGSTTVPVDLDLWTDRRVEYSFASAREQQLAGRFPYSPSNLCSGCSVNRYCAEYGGDLAHTVPQPWEQSSKPVLLSSAAVVMMGAAEPTQQEEQQGE